jgi:hypothetical protein
VRSDSPRLVAILIGLFVMGCDALTPTSRHVIREDVVAPGDLTLSANNGTTVPLTLVVNGSPIRELSPGSQVTITSGDLPSLPWAAEVRFVRGRTLVSLAVHAGDVVVGTNGSKGVGARVDLSCGRVDLWSGTPLLGPARGDGVPGDCNP